MAHRDLHRVIAGLAAALVAGPAIAHSAGAAGAAEARAVEQALAMVLLMGALLYGRGVAILWRKAGVGRGIGSSKVACFGSGWALLGAALLSPIDELAAHSFAAHMVQHELLMVAAAPLIVLGRPLEAWAWAVPRRVQRTLARGMQARTVRGVTTLATSTLGAWTIHAAVLWIWHLPVLFKAALLWLPLHIVQHACFFVSALGFWWSAFGGRERVANASSLASLFTTMLHTSALGALLTFAPTAWYSLEPTGAFGLTVLEDQQLGGLVMWIPGGFAYLVAALVVIRSWLREPRARILASRRRQADLLLSSRR